MVMLCLIPFTTISGSLTSTSVSCAARLLDTTKRIVTSDTIRQMRLGILIIRGLISNKFGYGKKSKNDWHKQETEDVKGSKFKIQDSGFKVQGSRFRIQDSRFKVQVKTFRLTVYFSRFTI
jgi:hypothetical protein